MLHDIIEAIVHFSSESFFDYFLFYGTATGEGPVSKLI